MDIHDVLSGGSDYVRANKPTSLDMDRIGEIVLGMKSITSEARSFDEHQAKWRAHIEQFVDFDALTWQAMQVAFDIMDIRDAYDFHRMRNSKARNNKFVGIVQAVFDGFLLGAQFEQRGGHR